MVTTKENFWIALAPYFFPIYSIFAIAIYGGAQPFSQRAAVWAVALRRDRRHMGVPFHVHLLDDSQKPD